VDHPKVVERYRAAQPEGVHDGDGDHTTEQLRAALVAARDLFERLVSEGEVGSAETPPTPFQDLIAEDERLERERAGREDRYAPTFEEGDDRPREHVDTGGMPILGPDGRPITDR